MLLEESLCQIVQTRLRNTIFSLAHGCLPTHCFLTRSLLSANALFAIRRLPLQEGPRSHARRDLLLQIQKSAQAQWEKDKVFEAKADGDAEGQAARKKFFGNFPYPYMNGLLHLGHAFTLSKVGPQLRIAF